MNHTATFAIQPVTFTPTVPGVLRARLGPDRAESVSVGSECLIVWWETADHRWRQCADIVICPRTPSREQAHATIADARRHNTGAAVLAGPWAAGCLLRIDGHGEQCLAMRADPHIVRYAVVSFAWWSTGFTGPALPFLDT